MMVLDQLKFAQDLAIFVGPGSSGTKVGGGLDPYLPVRWSLEKKLSDWGRQQARRTK
jgi:hypothetical protein